MLFVTGLAKDVHVFIDGAAESEGEIIVVESPSTVGKPSTGTTPQNANRASAKTPTARSKLNAVFVHGSGTTIGRYYVPAGTGPQASGSHASVGIHSIFASGTTYGLKMINAGNDDCSLNVEFFETQ